MGTVLETVVISRPTVTGDSSGLQAYRGWEQLDLDSRLTITKYRKQHKTRKTAETSPKPYKTKQKAARAAETSTKYIKQFKAAKLPQTSPKLYKTKQNAARAARAVAVVFAVLWRHRVFLSCAFGLRGAAGQQGSKAARQQGSKAADRDWGQPWIPGLL